MKLGSPARGLCAMGRRGWLDMVNSVDTIETGGTLSIESTRRRVPCGVAEQAARLSWQLDVGPGDWAEPGLEKILTD